MEWEEGRRGGGEGGGEEKKEKEVEVAFCSLERTAFQISARAYFSINPIRIELRPFVTPHPSKLLSDRALITSFFFFFFFLHRSIVVVVLDSSSLVCARMYTRIEHTRRLFSPPRNWRILIDGDPPGGGDA